MIRLRPAGALLLLLGVLAGCTPADEPIAALAVRDGRPVALLYVGHDAGYSRLSVSEDPPETEPDDHVVARWAVGKLADGVRYTLDGDSHRGSIPIGFTTADLPRIGADQVLAATGRDKTKVVSRAAFTLKASGSCN